MNNWRFLFLFLCLTFSPMTGISADLPVPGSSYTEYLQFNTPIETLFIDDLGYFNRYQIYGIPDEMLKNYLINAIQSESVPEGFIPLENIPIRLTKYRNPENVFDFSFIEPGESVKTGFDYYQGDYNFRFVSIFLENNLNGLNYQFYGNDLIYKGRYGLFNGARQGDVLQQDYDLALFYPWRKWKILIRGNHRAKNPAVIHGVSTTGVKKNRQSEFYLELYKSSPGDSVYLLYRMAGGTYRYTDNTGIAPLKAEFSSHSISMGKYFYRKKKFHHNFRLKINANYLFPQFRRMVQNRAELNWNQHFNPVPRIEFDFSESLLRLGRSSYFIPDAGVLFKISKSMNLKFGRKTFIDYAPFQYRLEYGEIKLPIEEEKINTIERQSMVYEIRFGETLRWENGLYFCDYSDYYVPFHVDSLNGIEIKRISRSLRLFNSIAELNLPLNLNLFLKGSMLFDIPVDVPFFWYRRQFSCRLAYEKNLFSRLQLKICIEGVAYQPVNNMAYSYANNFTYVKKRESQLIPMDRYWVGWGNFNISATVKSFTIFYHAGSLSSGDFLPVPETLFRGRFVYFGVRWWFLN